MKVRGLDNHLRNKNRNFVLFTQVANAIIALISGKLIALYILPEAFGNYNIQFAAYTFFSTLLITPFIQFIKTSNKTLLPKIGSRFFFSTICFLVLIAYILLVGFLYSYYDFFDKTLFLILFFFIPLMAASSILSDHLNIYGKIVAFSWLSMIKTVSSLLFIVIFFALGLSFVNDVYILWLMQFVGGLIGLIFFTSKYQFYTSKFKIGFKAFLKRYISFAGPLMFLAIWTWINNYFDRYAIEYYMSIEDVGVYNASYGLGSKVFLLLSPIFMVLVTPTVFGRVKPERKRNAIKKHSIYYLALAIPILIMTYILKDFIGNLLLSQNYSEGFFVIFWIALAFFMYTLAQLYELFFYSELRTKTILTANVMAAVINIVLNIVLIPRFGILGAALSTCLGFMTYLGVVFMKFQKKQLDSGLKNKNNIV